MVTEVFTYGAKKYQDRNWELGIANDRLFAAVQRHLWEYQAGHDIDPESGLPHIAHAVATGLMLLHNQLKGK